MASSPRQSSIRSLSLNLDQPEISQVDLHAEYSFVNKLKTGLQWLTDPFNKCCISKTKHQSTSKNSFDSQCLKPQFNQVHNLLKYFTFGIMFTNGILGFIIFIIGLWSSFEHRKINNMPTVNTQDSTSLNPFSFLGIILCICGLLFFLLCLISCLGINRENLNLLRISVIGQLLTLIIFLMSAIMILIWGEKIRNKINETLIIGLKLHYHLDKAWTAFFDQLHMSYFCCGVYSFNDWNDNPHYACTSSNILQNIDACSVPFTCCKTEQAADDIQVLINSLGYTCGMKVLPSDNLTMNMNEIQERIHVNGCFDEILPIIQQLVVTAAVLMFLICVIVFVTIFLTCLLIFEIRLTVSNVEQYCRKRKLRHKDNYSEREEEKF